MSRPRLYATRAEKDAAYSQRKQQRKVYAPLPPGPYRVIYADPPWWYQSNNPRYHGNARDKYPLLKTPEICALPVKRLRAPRAVLFLWVTNPNLPEGLTVLTAWGFIYRTSFVWDKERSNFGHYHNGRHEILLVGTAGSCKPDRHSLEDSVRRMPVREGEHSVKPDAWRQMIDYLYPEGRRLELFARSRAEGWDVWGNQVEMASTP